MADIHHQDEGRVPVVSGSLSQGSGRASLLGMSSADVTLSIRLDLPGGGRIGPGKLALMRALDEAGSLRKAARVLGMSYRRVWKLTEELNTAAGFTVVEKVAGGDGGGGAKLSGRGADLLKACEAVILAAETTTRAERANVKALIAAERS